MKTTWRSVLVSTWKRVLRTRRTFPVYTRRRVSRDRTSRKGLTQSYWYPVETHPTVKSKQRENEDNVAVSACGTWRRVLRTRRTVPLSRAFSWANRGVESMVCSVDRSGRDCGRTGRAGHWHIMYWRKKKKI